MKKDTHPDYHVIDVKMTNGDIVQIYINRQIDGIPVRGSGMTAVIVVMGGMRGTSYNQAFQGIIIFGAMILAAVNGRLNFGVLQGVCHTSARTIAMIFFSAMSIPRKCVFEHMCCNTNIRVTTLKSRTIRRKMK